MKTDPCQSYQGKLVDYADGQLSPEQAKEVADHVQACPSCQQLLTALKQSLGISQGLWHTAYEQTQSISIPAHVRKHTRFFHKLIAIAACVALAGVGWLIYHRSQAQTGPTIAQIKQDIQDAQHVASQLMVAQILASCEGTEDILERHYHYLEETYPEKYRALQQGTTETSFKERDL